MYAGTGYYIDIESSDSFTTTRGEGYFKTVPELKAKLMDGMSGQPIEDFENKGYEWQLYDGNSMEIMTPDTVSTIIKVKKSEKGTWLKVNDPDNGGLEVASMFVQIDYERGFDLDNIWYNLLPDQGIASLYGYYGDERTVTIPYAKTLYSQVTWTEDRYKITEIDGSVFANNNKLRKVTIGLNVTKIGEQAFYKAKNLKTIIVKSKKLKTVGKNAFKGINKKATFDVPNSKIKAYKKLFIKAGAPKTIKVK